MGGRGASSGGKYGKNGNTVYGTEYTTLYRSGNIKFVRYNNGLATPPLETMTKGRVYVTVNNQNKLKSIVYFDKNNKKYKQVDLDHPHKINRKWINPHTHKGYAHNEKGDYEASVKEAKMVDRVQKTWYNHINGK